MNPASNLDKEIDKTLEIVEKIIKNGDIKNEI
jgi:hypothetical protein